jgi:hypothetical protein
MMGRREKKEKNKGGKSKEGKKYIYIYEKEMGSLLVGGFSSLLVKLANFLFFLHK